jgi:hypothetical protein
VNDYINRPREANRVCRRKRRVYEMDILKSIKAKMKNEV